MKVTDIKDISCRLCDEIDVAHYAKSLCEPCFRRAIYVKRRDNTDVDTAIEKLIQEKEL